MKVQFAYKSETATLVAVSNIFTAPETGWAAELEYEEVSDWIFVECELEEVAGKIEELGSRRSDKMNKTARLLQYELEDSQPHQRLKPLPRFGGASNLWRNHGSTKRKSIRGEEKREAQFWQNVGLAFGRKSTPMA